MREFKGTQARRQKDPYLTQKIISASPEQLISYIYDVGISACGRKDSVKAGKAVRELINALNFEHKETALNFFQIYRYISGLINRNQFEQAREMLSDLRNTWNKAMKIA